MNRVGGGSWRRTVGLSSDLVSLELHPRPVRELVRQDGCEEDLGDGSGEGLVEFSLGIDGGGMSAWIVVAGGSEWESRTVGLDLVCSVAYRRDRGAATSRLVDSLDRSGRRDWSRCAMVKTGRMKRAKQDTIY